ncbi:hypothetical protein ABPG77_004916 [Micractinium sp. CCAP 211/92]
MAVAGAGSLPAARLSEDDLYELRIRGLDLGESYADEGPLVQGPIQQPQEEAGAGGGLAVGAEPAGFRGPQLTADDGGDLLDLHANWSAEQEIIDTEGALSVFKDDMPLDEVELDNDEVAALVRELLGDSALVQGGAAALPAEQGGSIEPRLAGPTQTMPIRALAALTPQSMPAQSASMGLRETGLHQFIVPPGAAGGTSMGAIHMAGLAPGVLYAEPVAGMQPATPVVFPLSAAASVEGQVAEPIGLPAFVLPQPSVGLDLPTTSMSLHAAGPRLSGKVPADLALALAAARRSAAERTPAFSSAAAAAAAGGQLAFTTLAGAAGPGQQQRTPPPTAAQSGEPSAPRSPRRKQPEAETEAAMVQTSEEATLALAGTSGRMQSSPSQPAASTAAAAAGLVGPKILEAELAFSGSAAAAASAAAHDSRVALAGSTGTLAQSAGTSTSAPAKKRSVGRKAGRDTAERINELQEFLNRPESSRVLSEEMESSGREDQSTLSRYRQARRVKELLRTPAPESKGPFKRTVCQLERINGRLSFNGEQLFHTGVLLGEILRLSFWVGGRQLALPSGSAVMECKLQRATGQFKPQKAWTYLLLKELELATGLEPPVLATGQEPEKRKLLYTLALWLREVINDVAHVDASLELREEAATEQKEQEQKQQQQLQQAQQSTAQQEPAQEQEQQQEQQQQQPAREQEEQQQQPARELSSSSSRNLRKRKR